MPSRYSKSGTWFDIDAPISFAMQSPNCFEISALRVVRLVAIGDLPAVVVDELRQRAGNLMIGLTAKGISLSAHVGG